MTLFADPLWPKASTLLQSGNAVVSPLALVGIPLYLGSLSPGRCDLAPGALRAALSRFSCYDLEHGIDLQDMRLQDYGDLAVAELSPEDALLPIVHQLQAIRRQSSLLLALGGDNSITRPLVHAAAPVLANIGLITLDAHFDVRSTAGGLTNGNPVSALLEDGLPGKNIVQIGLQSFANSAHYADLAKSAGIRFFTLEKVREYGISSVSAAALKCLAHTDCIVVDFDLDVLDRLWVPAAPGARPGGMLPAELYEAAFTLGADSRVVAADFVELDPARDIADIGVMNAAKCLLYFLSGVRSRDEQA